MSSYDHTGRKAELGGAFPGLAVSNLSRSVPLDDGFYDHNEQGSRPAAAAAESDDLKKPAAAAEVDARVGEDLGWWEHRFELVISSNCAQRSLIAVLHVRRLCWSAILENAPQRRRDRCAVRSCA